MTTTMRAALGLLLGTALAAGGCSGDRDADRDATIRTDQQTATTGQTGDPAMAGQQGQPQGGDMRLEVDVSARVLHVYRGGQRTETHPVAVGTDRWPTETGEWTISQVIWNPRWVPPQQEWAEDNEPKEPGDPDNPLGTAQLVYDAPRSIHGTNQPESIGRAVSHGSIRVTNDVAEQLARQAMEAGGAARDEDFFRRARQNRTERQEVTLPQPIPIRVHGGQ